MASDRESGFTELYDEHIWDVFGFFGYRVRAREVAEDLTQSTFERALRAWDRYDPSRASHRTWLLAIAQNLLIDHYRRDRSAKQSELDEEGVEEALGQQPAIDESLGLDPEVADALGQLGERERELIALRFGGDLTGPEIAEITGLTLANVQQILSRSLRRMRAHLDEDRAGSADSGEVGPLGGERAGAGDANRGDHQ